LKKDAEKFKKQKERELDKGAPRDPSTETLKEYCEWWLQNRSDRQALRPGTIDLYRQTLERLNSYFGETYLIRNINRRKAQMFLAEIKPLQNQECLSSWTHHRTLRHCRTLFGDAVSDGVALQNPFAKIKGPKTIPSLWYRVTPSEYKELLRVTTSIREKTLFALAYTGGLRLTEALALRWSDIDFEKEEVTIINRPGTETLPPFNIKDYEARTIPLPQHTIDLLTELQDKSPDKVDYVLLTEERYRRIIAKWRQCRATGRAWYNRYYANNVLRDFKKRAKRANIKPGSRSLTIHTLRKCCCQNWVDGGLPITTVKELMGHADISTTQKYYCTVDDDHRAKAAAIVNKMLDTEKSDLKMTFSDDFASDIGEKEGAKVSVSDDNINSCEINLRA
jgi:integrase